MTDFSSIEHLQKSLPSADKRFYVVNIQNGDVVMHTEIEFDARKFLRKMDQSSEYMVETRYKFIEGDPGDEQPDNFGDILPRDESQDISRPDEGLLNTEFADY